MRRAVVVLIGASLAIASCDRRRAATDSTTASTHRVDTASRVASPARADTADSNAVLYEGDDAPPWLNAMLVPGAKFDSAVVDSLPGGVTCYSFPRYVVVRRQLKELGEDIVVRHLSGGARPTRASREQCRPDSLAGDFIVRNKWAEYYAGLDGRWLILDSGTGPARTMIIYDVDARRQIASFDGDVAGWRDSTTLLVWVAADSVPRSRCVKIPESLGASVDSLMALDVRSGRMSWAGKWRCAARQ